MKAIEDGGPDLAFTRCGNPECGFAGELGDSQPREVCPGCGSTQRIVVAEMGAGQFAEGAIESLTPPPSEASLDPVAGEARPPLAQGPLDGIPTQAQCDEDACRQLLAQTRQQLAVVKANYFLAVNGLLFDEHKKGVHPQQVKFDVDKLEKAVELLEGILTGLPDSLHISPLAVAAPTVVSKLPAKAKK